MPQASAAQARVMAGMFAESRVIWLSADDDGFENPTFAAMRRKGFIEPTGQTDTWPHDRPCRAYRLTADGIRALARHLLHRAAAT